MDLSARNTQLELLRAAPDLFALTDPDTRILEAAAAWATTLGYTPPELVGTRLADLLDPAERDKLLAARDTAIYTGSAVPVELRIPARDRTPCALALTVKASAEQDLLAVFARDLTAQRDTEERLNIAQARLHELRRVEAVALLVGGIMHHVNNLFCVSMGYLKLLADEIGEGPARGYLQEVQGATDRAAELVRQLLGLARDPDPSGPVDVVRAVTRLQPLIQQLVTEQVEFQVELASGALPDVRAGRAQVEQLVVNLAFAAREAMPDGGELRVRTSLAPSGELVNLSFTHRGRAPRPGRVQLVEPLPAWASRFGLRFAQQILELCGGTLTETVEPDGLTTRSAHLPVQPQVEPDEEVGPLVTAPHGQETILVVEDEEKLRALIVRSLRRHGYDLLVAPEGEEALRVAREHAGPIHLLLTDVVMPGMSGVDVAAHLMARLPSVRVLYISGHGEAALAAAGPLPQGVSVLEKPFRPAVLAQRVRELLDR